MSYAPPHTAVSFGIKYFMKLLEQILQECGGDTLKSFSVIPTFGGYFRSIKVISEFSSEKIVLALKRNKIILKGENMQIGKYFEDDVFIKGNIKVIEIE